MNKIIFQIGLLAFCVSVVYFGTLGMNILDMAARSFIVFIVVVTGLALLLIAGASLSAKESPEKAVGETDGQVDGATVRRTPVQATK